MTNFITISAKFSSGIKLRSFRINSGKPNISKVYILSVTIFSTKITQGTIRGNNTTSIEAMNISNGHKNRQLFFLLHKKDFVLVLVE